MGCIDWLDRLASRDSPDLGDDGGPMRKKAKHEHCGIELLKGFPEKNRTNLGSGRHRRRFGDQSRNTEQKVRWNLPCQEDVVQEREQQPFTLRGATAPGGLPPPEPEEASPEICSLEGLGVGI